MIIPTPEVGTRHITYEEYGEIYKGGGTPWVSPALPNVDWAWGYFRLVDRLVKSGVRIKALRITQQQADAITEYCRQSGFVWPQCLAGYRVQIKD